MASSISSFASWIQWLSWKSNLSSIENDRLFFSLSARDAQYPSSCSGLNMISNQKISDSLHKYALRTATLRSLQNGHLSFFYHNEKGNWKVEDFPNTTNLDEWLAKQSADIWEIADERGTCRLLYVCKKKVGEYKTREELFAQLKQESGVLWKVVHLLDDRVKYIRAKKDLWGQPYYSEVDFDCLADVAEELSGKIPVSTMNENAPQSWWKKIQLFILGGLAFSAYQKFQNSIPEMSLTSVMLQGTFAYTVTMQRLSKPYATTIALLSLFKSTKAQNSPPVVVNPSPSITVYPSQPFNQIFPASAFFRDPDDDALSITLSSVPQIIQASIIKLGGTLSETISTTITPIRIQKDGNFLHLFGTSGYQIWNASNFPPSLIGSYPFSISSEVANQDLAIASGNFAYLVSGNAPNAVIRVLNITDPASPVLIANITTVAVPNGYLCGYSYAITLDQKQNVLWISDQCTLYAYSVGDPANPVFLSYSGSLSGTTSLTLNVDSSQFVYYCDLAGFEILNGVNPASPTIVDTFTFLTVCATPSGGPPRSSNGFFFGQSPNLYMMNYPNTSPATLYLFDISTPSTPFALSSYSSAIPESFTVSGPYAFLSIASANFPLIIDWSNHTNPKQYIFPSSPSTNYLAVEGNVLYFTDGVSQFGRLSFNDIQLSISSLTWQSNGTHVFEISANDGLGGVASVNFTVIVVNRNPIVSHAISNQTAFVDLFYQLPLNVNQTFSAPDGAPLILSVANLPAWLNFNSTESLLSGIPTIQYVGQTEFQVIATDPFGQTATDAVSLFVVQLQSTGGSNDTTGASNNFPGTHTSNSSTPGIVIGTLLGFGGIVGSAIGIYFFVRRRKTSTEVSQDRFELSSVSRPNIREVFGDNKYGWFQSIENEKNQIFYKTGLLVRNADGVIGRGHYGELSICWSFEKEQYVVAKTVRGQKNFGASYQEADLQRRASGPNICPIYNTIKDETRETLTHLMPIAGLNNLENVRYRITKGSKDPSAYVLFVAKDVLTGLAHIHSHHIYHCDAKSSNVITNNKGESMITDFGLSVQQNSPILNKIESDRRYQSPERATGVQFRADYDDSWAAGCLLLEFMTGQKMQTLFPFLQQGAFQTFHLQPDFSLQTYQQKVQICMDQIHELHCPRDDSIWWLIQQLLKPENARLLPKQALLQAKCFNMLDQEKRESLFQSLVQQQKEELYPPVLSEQPLPISTESHTNNNPPSFYNYSQEEVFYSNIG